MFSKLGLQVYTVRDHIKDEASMDATFAKLAELGYSELQTAGWESETYAALAKKHGLTVVGTHYNFDKIINNIEDGDIVLMHSLYMSSANATRRLVPELIDEGYQLVTVSELLKYKGYDIENLKVIGSN
mgnify:CR=1 FL=1